MNNLGFRVVCVTLVITTLSLVLNGCGGQARIPIEGEIRVIQTGEPLRAGSILLEPLESTSAPKVAAEVKEGRFMFSKQSGPLPGQYRVKVYGPAPIGMDDPLRFQEQGEEMLNSELVSREFNEQSELTVVISRETEELSIEVRTTRDSLTIR